MTTSFFSFSSLASSSVLAATSGNGWFVAIRKRAGPTGGSLSSDFDEKALPSCKQSSHIIPTMSTSQRWALLEHPSHGPRPKQTPSHHWQLTPLPPSGGHTSGDPLVRLSSSASVGHSVRRRPTPGSPPNPGWGNSLGRGTNSSSHAKLSSERSAQGVFLREKGIVAKGTEGLGHKSKRKNEQ